MSDLAASWIKLSKVLADGYYVLKPKYATVSASIQMNGEKRKYFTRFLEEKYGLAGADLYFCVHKLPEHQRHLLWAKLSQKLNLFERYVLDFYHNTWSRYFFTNPQLHKAYIIEMIAQGLQSGEGLEDVKNGVFDKMNAMHPGAFHSQALRYAILRYARKEQQEVEKKDFTYHQKVEEILELFSRF